MKIEYRFEWAEDKNHALDVFRKLQAEEWEPVAFSSSGGLTLLLRRPRHSDANSNVSLLEQFYATPIEADEGISMRPAGAF